MDAQQQAWKTAPYPSSPETDEHSPTVGVVRQSAVGGASLRAASRCERKLRRLDYERAGEAIIETSSAQLIGEAEALLGDGRGHLGAARDFS